MLDRWVFGLLENVLKPLVTDIHKILDKTLKLNIKKDELLYVLQQVIKLETKRIYVNAILYLLMTIIITWGIYGLVARYPQQILR
jgi:hypothetical protein